MAKNEEERTYTQSPFAQYITAFPLELRLFWFVDDLGVWVCLPELYRAEQEVNATVEVEVDGETTTKRGDEIPTEQRLRRILIDGYHWMNEAQADRKSQLKPEQINAAKSALKSLGLALGLELKNDNG